MPKECQDELFFFLEEKYRQYNRPEFIETDPISIPHLFTNKQDIEIAGFLTATISWGQRPTILKNARELMRRMDFSPFDFIREHSLTELKSLQSFFHRTFNGIDCIHFITALRQLYLHYPSLEDLFIQHPSDRVDLFSQMTEWRTTFFNITHPKRTEKHFSDISSGSAGKRLNMFLRWMIRKDEMGVDFGIWTNISPAILTCPLDVHSGRVSRKLHLLQRRQNDWKAATELTENLKKYDPTDPVKYDFALFGLGVFEKF